MKPLAVSLGDPAGIGPEIIARAWEERRRHDLPAFFGVGDPNAIAKVWNGPVRIIDEPSETAGIFDEALALLQLESSGEIRPGEPDSAGARCALDSLEMAVGLARSGAAGAVVTGPVAKVRLYDIGFTHPGQTEFIAERCGVSRDNIAMMLAGPSLKTVPITGHIPLRDVPGVLSVDMIVNKGRAVARGLTRNFGIAKPRLAFAGMNPHAGEHGSIGREEVDIMEPALVRLREEGIDCIGPLPADTMFHAAARETYDAALCVYHDQALIPLKTLHFDEGVNLTLGLPIVRTSPDHGTAFDIAGTGKADPGAMIAAIGMAGFCAGRRAEAAARAE